MEIKMIYNTVSNWQHSEPSSFIFWGQASSRRGGQGRRKMKADPILEGGKEKWLGLKGKLWQALMLEGGCFHLCFLFHSLPCSHLPFLFSSVLFLSLNFLSYPWIVTEWMKEPKHGLYAFEREDVPVPMPSIHELFLTWLCSRMDLFHRVESGSSKYISKDGVSWLALINSLCSQPCTGKTEKTPLPRGFKSPAGMASTSSGGLEAPRTS